LSPIPTTPLIVVAPRLSRTLSSIKGRFNIIRLNHSGSRPCLRLPLLAGARGNYSRSSPSRISVYLPVGLLATGIILSFELQVPGFTRFPDHRCVTTMWHKAVHRGVGFPLAHLSQASTGLITPGHQRAIWDISFTSGIPVIRRV